MEQQRNLADFTQEFTWHNYNESQTKEKILFVSLLRELCDLIEQPKHNKGRKPVDYSDMIYSLALKSYLTFSSRRVHSDLKMCAERNHVEKAFHFNTLLKYLENKDLKYILIKLIEVSALPLKQVELDFAIDATGFGTSRYETWCNIRNMKNPRIKLFRKAHCVYGVKTNIITSVDITEGHVNDCTRFEPLIKRTSDNFIIREVSADKAYSSKVNLRLVSSIGAIPFIPFKSNTVRNSRGCMVWTRMYDYYKNHREEFLEHYHKRSNAESGFSMIKRKFGNSIRCKKEISQDNEILLKVLCHNLCVLIQEIFLNNINIDFQKCANTHVAHN